MKQKEERFKCVALTTVGGWISMIVAFLVGLYLASRGKRTSACDGNLLLCTELRDEDEERKDTREFRGEKETDRTSRDSRISCAES